MSSAAYAHKYYLKHRDRLLARQRERRIERAATARARYAHDPASSKFRTLTYFRAHREVKAAINHRYRAKRAGCARGSFTASDWLAIKTQFDFRCLGCGQREPDIKLTVDHVIPLSLGGRNDPENIQPLCRSCNDRKEDQTTDYRPVGAVA